MKQISTILFFMICLSSHSQTVPADTIEEALVVVDVMPVFPGGESAMVHFIRENIDYPKKESDKGIEGTCYLHFVVEKNGTLTGIYVLRGLANGPLCDAEAIRIIEVMPKWTPGKLNGKIVRTQFNLPIKYVLPKGENKK